MVEEQVGEELVVVDLQPHLTSDEGEALPEFEEEFLDVRDELGFGFAFGVASGQGEEVENVRILRGLLGEVGVRRRQGGSEVGGSATQALVEPISIWCTRTARDHPCSTAAAAYQRRVSASPSLSIRMMLCPHGNVAAACCNIGKLGQASAKDFI